MHHLDPHERPPDGIRNVYKKYQKMKLKDIDLDENIIDLTSDTSTSSDPKVRVVKLYTGEDLNAIFRSFAGEALQAADLPRSTPVYEHSDMPGRKHPNLPNTTNYLSLTLPFPFLAVISSQS
jgi:alkylated DNA repair protein alkB family protein 1